MKVWLQFLFSKAFVKTLGGILLVWVLILSGTWVYLHFYSHHGERVEMPDLKGMPYESAAEACESLGMSVVHLDSIYADAGQPFHVVEQVPPPGSGVKAGRNIYLTTYRATPPAEFVAVEEGQDLSVARIVLENKGFNVTERSEPNVSLVNRIVRIEDKNGRILQPTDRLRRGSAVTLYYGRTTSERVMVPDCSGLILDSARAVLRRAQLSVGLVEYSLEIEDESDSLEAVVIEQTPMPSEEALLPAGTELDLYLGEEGEAPRFELEIEK